MAVVLNFIKEIRESRGLTIEYVAKRGGLSKSTVWEIENGKYLPNFVTMLLICKGLDSSLNDVFMNYDHPKVNEFLQNKK